MAGRVPMAFRVGNWRCLCDVCLALVRVRANLWVSTVKYDCRQIVNVVNVQNETNGWATRSLSPGLQSACACVRVCVKTSRQMVIVVGPDFIVTYARHKLRKLLKVVLPTSSYAF